MLSSRFHLKSLQEREEEELPLRERLNKIDYKVDIKREILDEQIMFFCKISYTNTPTAIELIDHLLGGPNMEYPCMEVRDSFKCFQVCRADLMKNIKETQENILFFEDRKTTDASIIVVVVQPNRKVDNIILYTLVGMTLNVAPRVAFCCYFVLRGM